MKTKTYWMISLASASGMRITVEHFEADTEHEAIRIAYVNVPAAYFSVVSVLRFPEKFEPKE